MVAGSKSHILKLQILHDSEANDWNLRTMIVVPPLHWAGKGPVHGCPPDLSGSERHWDKSMKGAYQGHVQLAAGFSLAWYKHVGVDCSGSAKRPTLFFGLVHWGFLLGVLPPSVGVEKCSGLQSLITKRLPARLPHKSAELETSTLNPKGALPISFCSGPAGARGTLEDLPPGRALVF